MNKLFTCLWALCLTACSGASFDTQEKISSTRSTSSANDEPIADIVETDAAESIVQDESVAAEPIAVGGAFLACQYEDSSGSNEHQVGCQIHDEDNNSLAGLVEVQFSLADGREINYTFLIAENFPYKLHIAAQDLGDPNQSIRAKVAQKGRKDQAAEAEIPVTAVEKRPDRSIIAGYSEGVLALENMPNFGAAGAVQLQGGLCLVSSEEAFSGGTKIQAQACDENSEAQAFTLNNLGEGEFSIQDSDENCLDIPLENGVYLGRVNAYDTCHLSINQRFAIKTKNGVKTLVSLAGGERCFAIDPSNKTDVLLQDCEESELEATLE